MALSEVQKNALFQSIIDEVKEVKERILNNLDEDYIYSYIPDYEYERGAYENEGYDHDNDHKNAINEWLTAAVYMIYVNCHSVDAFRIVNSIISPDPSSVSLHESGFEGNDSVKINFQAFKNDQNARNLTYIVSKILKDLFMKLGLKRVLEQVIPHYSENNATLNKVTGYHSIHKSWLYMAPLEHCLYLIRYSMKHHQDYYDNDDY